MNEKERRLLDRFVEKAKESIPELAGVVLYGSVARGEQDRRSDMDLLVIIESKSAMKYSRVVARIVTEIDIELRPKRDLKPLITNMKDLDADFIRNVFMDGLVVYGKMLVTPDGLRLKPYTLVSYDISNKSKSLKVKISRMVHGYSGRKVLSNRKYEYQYKGLVSVYDAKLISPSTLILPRASAEKFVEDLKKLGAEVETFDIWM